MSLSLEIYHFQAFVISEMKPLSLYSLQNVVMFLKVFLARYIKNPYTWFLPTPLCICMCMYTCVCICVCMCMEAGGQRWASFLRYYPPSFLKQCLSLTWRFLIWLDWPGIPLPPPQQDWDHKTGLLHLQCLCGFWGSNSGPHACTASSLPTEPCSQLSVYLGFHRIGDY